MKPEDAGTAASSYTPGAGMGDYSNIMAMLGPYFAVVAIIAIAMFAFYIFIWWKIYSKAGYSGALALINIAGIIPLIGWIIPLGLIIWFAFAQWPVLKGAKPGVDTSSKGPVQA